MNSIYADPLYTFIRIYKNDDFRVTKEKAPKDVSFGAFLRWTTKIRTWTNRTKTCCATITP